MSALSYLLSRVELIVKSSLVPSSLMGTFLVSSGAALDFLLLPVELSGTFSIVKKHSEEARLRSGCKGSCRSSSPRELQWQEQVP